MRERDSNETIEGIDNLLAAREKQIEKFGEASELSAFAKGELLVLLRDVRRQRKAMGSSNATKKRAGPNKNATS